MARAATAAALLRGVGVLLTLATSGVSCQHLSATVATDSPFALSGASPHVLLFKPAASRVAVDLPGAVLLPDVPGEYIVRGSDNGTLHIQAVDLVRWAADALPIMSDVFGANAAPADSATGAGFWVETLRDEAADGCVLHEAPDVGLHISTGGGPGPCGLRTRDGCSQLGVDPAVSRCGFASGATSVNPFNDRLLISLGNITLGSASAAGALRLTSNERTLGAIELGFNTTTAVLRWAPQTAERDQRGSAMFSFPRWVELQSAPLGDCGGVISNISLTIAIKHARLSYTCGDHLMAAFNGTLVEHGIDWRTFAPSSAGELSLSIRVTQGQVTFRRFEVASLRGHGHLRAQLAPIPNLNGGGSPFLGLAHAPHLAALGYLDVTKPPFAADETGQRDSSVALQAAINYCRRNYLTVFLPSGQYLVSKTLVAKQTERLDAIDGTNGYWQQARYVPSRIVGSTKGGKPTIVLAPDSFTDAAKPQPVVWLWMQNSAAGPFDPPFDGQPQPNANCNQVFQGIDIRMSPGNPGAIGIRARGAQMMVVQDVTIFAGDGLVGLSGGSGSGGSHYGVTVIGGKYGVDFTTAQPGPVISGFTLENQTCSALVYAGLQTLTAVGLRVRALVPMAQPAIVAGCDAATRTVPTWQGKLFRQGCELAQFADPLTVQPCLSSNSGPLSLVDSILELGPSSRQPVALATAASLYLHNVWVAGAATLAEFHSGGTLPSPGMPWVEIQEYARGIGQTYTDPEDPDGTSSVSFSSGVHLLAANDLTPLAHGNTNVTTTELIVGLRTSAIGPEDSLVTQHLYSGVPARLLPSFESTNAVFAAGPLNDCGASSDGVTDNAEALDKCVALAAEKSPLGVVVLGRGIYRTSRTLVLPPGVSLVGAGLHLTSLVPTSAGFQVDAARTARGAGTPVLRTVGGATVVAALSLSTWAHYDTVSAVEWGAGEQSLWMQNHVNRVRSLCDLRACVSVEFISDRMHFGSADDRVRHQWGDASGFYNGCRLGTKFYSECKHKSIDPPTVQAARQARRAVGVDHRCATHTHGLLSHLPIEIYYRKSLYAFRLGRVLQPVQRGRDGYARNESLFGTCPTLVPQAFDKETCWRISLLILPLTFITVTRQRDQLGPSFHPSSHSHSAKRPIGRNRHYGCR